MLASVKIGNVDVAEYIIKKGLAKSYNGVARLKPTEWILVNINFILKIKETFHELKNYQVNLDSFYFSIS